MLACLLLASLPFQNAKWIGESPTPAGVHGTWLQLGAKVSESLPKNAIIVRKNFALRKTAVRRGTAYVCGLGFYELRLNGAAVDPSRILAPGWSDPRQRVLYDEYDVRDKVRSGGNELEIVLSPGYSDDAFPWSWRWPFAKRAIAEVRVEYTDGTEETVVSDGTWQWTDRQSIVRASLYDGETFDARLAKAADWRPVAELDDLGLRLEPNPGPPVRKYDPHLPTSVRKVPSGWLLDFGDNCAGVIEFRLSLPRGAIVTIRHGEELSVDGNELDVRTQRTARQEDVYVASGEKDGETWSPGFTYHGFRYAIVSGVSEPQARAENFRRLRVSADVGEIATFSCSDETLNWLWESARRSMRSNFVSYPTDCCQRDERTPCLMDSRVYEETAAMAFDMRDFYIKWLGDATGYQRGVDSGHGNNANPDWSGDAMSVAGVLLRHYAATNAIERHYPAIREVALDFGRRCPSGIWRKGFGDWCPPAREAKGDTRFSSVSLVNTVCLFDCYRTMSRLAAAIGNGEDAKRFADRAEAVRRAFRTEFLLADGTVGDGLQTDYAVPLAFGLFSESETPRLVSNLVSRIRKDDCGRMGTGIFGTRYIGDVLLEYGYGDCWLEMMRGSEYPGFGYMKSVGATSLWERWERDGDMNSHNHAMMSGAATCLLTHLAGIRPAADGWTSVCIRPVFPKGLSWVSCTRKLPVGMLSVHWLRENGKVILKVEVPNGLPAVLRLPNANERVLPVGKTSVVIDG